MPPSAGYNLAASLYDKKEKYLNSFEKNKLLPLLGDVKNLRILDAGAGTGRLAVALHQLGAEVTALDASEEMLKILSYKDKAVEVVAGDVENLPFDDGVFDIVVAAFLIVHLKDPERFFDEAYRVLKDNGRLAVTNINQKEAPVVVVDGKGRQTPSAPLGKGGGIMEIKIESYRHRPERIKEILEELAFTVEKEIIVKEGENWVNQIVVARK